MFMVMALHVNYFALGVPTKSDLCTNPINAITRSFFEVLCVGAVDLFVLISGWFSIRPSRKGFLKFYFQSFFFITLINIIGVLTFNVHGIKLFLGESFLMSNAWFVVAYAGLFILSPILNIFANNAPYRTFKIVIISFFVIQTIYGCIFDTIGFSQGYSIISFIGLYLLGRFAKLYHSRFAIYGKWMTMISLALCWALNLIAIYYNLGDIAKNLSIWYTSPLIITAMLGVIMWTSTIMPFYNKLINFVASSSFSVYLIHVCNKWSTGIYKSIATDIYNNWTGFEYIGIIVGFMIFVYLLAIIIDQLRKLAWNLLIKTSLVKKFVLQVN